MDTEIKMGNFFFLFEKRPFLGAFTKLRKGISSFVMLACLSIRTEELGFHQTDCHEIRYLSTF